ncbi:MAG TPA: FecR domain-containing protein [Opitutaceae bacterium]|nr:FecR domain-containing protein [Opitutaceae bacterium]
MNAFPANPDPALEEQAALWAARLDGSTLTADDRNALDAWLGASPLHRALLSSYCQFSADLEQQLPALVVAGAVELPEAAAPRRTARWFGWTAAAALAAAAVVAAILWAGRPRTQVANLASAIAQRQSFTLVDGSRVELNAQTSLAVAITARERHVRLATGEAFFTVQKDPGRPFVVETPFGSVQVTGTKFGVAADSPVTLQVTVVEGTVQARPAGADGRPGAPVALTAGEQLNAEPGGVRVRTLTAAALDDALAWREGQIVFENTPLGEALAAFARYHGQGLTATPDAGRLHIGGRYSLDDLDGFLTYLEDSQPVRVTRNLNGTVQVSLRAEP